MKNKITLFTLILGLGSLLTLNSCSKDDDTSGGGNKPATHVNSAKAKIDGTAMAIDLSACTATYEESQDVVEVTLFTADQTTILGLYFSLNKGNTLTIGGDDASGVLQYSNVNPDGIYSGTTGTLTLSTIDKTNQIVTGTFSFVASNGATADKTISEGSFSFKYTK